MKTIQIAENPSEIPVTMFTKEVVPGRSFFYHNIEGQWYILDVNGSLISDFVSNKDIVSLYNKSLIEDICGRDSSGN